LAEILRFVFEVKSLFDLYLSQKVQLLLVDFALHLHGHLLIYSYFKIVNNIQHPEMRHDISEIVKILKGERDATSLPLEFSPSPPYRDLSKSRKKLNADVAVFD